MVERGFVDEARIFVTSGSGGDGCTSFKREKYRPKGPPDGGNGGSGGSVILRVDTNIASLAHLADHPHQKAAPGRNGSGNTKHGASGADKVLLVPDGTIVRTEDGTVLADLVGEGTEFIGARGGRGGRGNHALATARRRAPGFAERGEQAEERRLHLELRLIADIGLVGLPNAGKSSLIARLSAANPKIASYPFTTLTPNLGVSEHSGARFVVADVPGLIEGASAGKGLGHRFLRHLQRCRLLCYVIDLTHEDPIETLGVLRNELRAFDPALADRSAVVALNKTDLVGGVTAHVVGTVVAARPFGMAIAVSAATGDGVDDLGRMLAEELTIAARERAEPSHRLVKLRPVDDAVTVLREGGSWRVKGERAERLLDRFDVGNPDALAFVQERLVAIGVEEKLAEAGARAGDEVRIGDVVLEYTPDEEVDAR